MTSRIFSINLDEVTFAKLGELQKKYPDKSRNAMIRHIIHVVHSGEHNKLEQITKELELVMSILAKKNSASTGNFQSGENNG